MAQLDYLVIIDRATYTRVYSSLTASINVHCSLRHYSSEVVNAYYVNHCLQLTRRHAMATMTGSITLTSAPEVRTESLGEASAEAEATDGSWVVTEIILLIKHVCKLGLHKKDILSGFSKLC